MECYRAFQGVSNIHAICGQDGQQSIDVHPYNPNLDATGHRWVGMLASFEFSLEYQKGAGNGVADVLSQVPIHLNCKTVCSLMEGNVVGAVSRSVVEANEELLCKHVLLEAAKLAPMHVVDWGGAQEADAILATC